MRLRSFISRIENYDRDIKLYFLYTLLANVAIGVFALVFNLYLLELGKHEDFIGLFNALQTLAMAASAVLLGKFITRYGIWLTVIGGLILYLLSAILLSIVTSTVFLLSMSVLWGAGAAMVFTPVMPFVVELTRARQRQEVAALTMSLVSLSTTIGSLVGGWSPFLFAYLFDFGRPSASAFRVTMLLGVAIAALAVIPLSRMSAQRKQNRPSDSPQVAPEPQFELTTAPDVRKRMIVYIAVGGLMALGGGAVFPFYNVFLKDIGASSGQIGLVFAFAWSLAAIVGLGSPWVSTRLGSQRGAAVVRLFPVPFFGLLIMFANLPLAIGAHLLRVSSISMSWSMESSFISEALPARVRYAVFGYRSAAWNVGFSISSFLAGGVIVRYGYGPTFAAYVAFMFIAMGLYYGYFRTIAVSSGFDEEDAARQSEISKDALPVVDQVDASSTFILKPGRGQPVVVVSDATDDGTSSSGNDSNNLRTTVERLRPESNRASRRRDEDGE